MTSTIHPAKLRPLVSVIVPTKGRIDFLEATLNSVRGQTYESWEAIVVDDGSSGVDLARIAEIAKLDQRITTLRNLGERRGASACRNQGLRAARGDYVVFLDSDDLLLPSCLEERLQTMEANLGIDFATFLTGTFFSIPGDSDRLWNIFNEDDDLDRFLRQDMPWQTAGPIWRKESVMKVGGWDERARSWQDWEFHIRALASGLNYTRISRVDSLYRQTQTGAISFLSRSPFHAVNRIGMFRRVTEVLRREHALNSRRRGLIAAHVFQHAFMFGLPFRRSVKIWWISWRLKLARGHEFLVVLACESSHRTLRAAARWCEMALFSDLFRATRSHLARAAAAPGGQQARERVNDEHIGHHL